VFFPDLSILVAGDLMRSFEVTQDFVNRIHESRLHRWNLMSRWKQLNHSRYGKKRSGFPGFYAICEGCHQDLKPGDGVLEFRSYRFCHNTLGCVQNLSKSSLTLELRNLMKVAAPTLRVV